MLALQTTAVAGTGDIWLGVVIVAVAPAYEVGRLREGGAPPSCRAPSPCWGRGGGAALSRVTWTALRLPAAVLHEGCASSTGTDAASSGKLEELSKH
ncbi:hypothetical protein [Arthrobacter sulfonylureivorans]|uniref:Uncharacterized protein n=1 Tax=Arthrobacter sulfonylureivorans TaxID=2486855 RepID=A0ABY3W4H2_9MICC|nr:hypothetical protein [Arthrobacter sulfonylureivorans]UNK45102.1 hypothetical protein MNQ99_14305 [Arthrobacter sulfonylureivorans]